MSTEANQEQPQRTHLAQALEYIEANKVEYLDSLLTLTTEYLKQAHAYSITEIEQTAHTVELFQRIIVHV